MTPARQTFVSCIAAVFLLLITGAVEVGDVNAEISPAVLATLKVGTVTSVGPASIGISGVEYRVKANAEILDHKGSAMELTEVFVRSEARFHLNKDNEIDMMVLRRPQ
ncbi:MAG TPA: hypothetical protein VFM24_01965 [Nitrospira sp.]|nr:hypothetical protein [Nitrospira sp.]